jgi:hypothetical protein
VPNRINDKTGQIFGRLRVVEMLPERDANGRVVFVAECRCGVRKAIRTDNLVRGRTKSCGSCRYSRESPRSKGYKDISGRKFGTLVAVRPEFRSRYAYWTCVCECGRTTSVRSSHLIGGKIRSCSCLRQPDLTGRRFGNVLVMSRSDDVRYRSTPNARYWNCACDCGVEFVELSNALTSGRRESCGCLKRLQFGRSRHGMAKAPEYRAWKKIRLDGSACEEWSRQGGFDLFIAYVGPRPKQSRLTRVDNSRPFEPGNAEWRTFKPRKSDAF